MKHSFEKLTDRRGTFSMKWTVKENELPMWVADMDFETAPAVAQAIRKKADTAVFGYTTVPDEYYAAVSRWWAARHAFHIEKDCLLFASGVVPAVSSIIRSLTAVGESVLLQPPVYNIFYNCVLNNGRRVTENRLTYRNGEYSIDFADLELRLADPQTTMMILCNPHNPIGKVWDKAALLEIGRLCAKHNVTVLSDEIHCDLTHPGINYTPFASLSDTCAENSVTCIAPSKAFNLAGLQSACVLAANPALRRKVTRGLNTDEVAEPNAFAIEAGIAAYTCGGEWLDALRAYIKGNIDAATEYIALNLPELKAVKSQATYLLWLDCQAIAYNNASVLCEVIRKETGLYLSDGSAYGENGKSFLRMNLATQRSRVLDGLERLKQGVKRYEEIAAEHPCGVV